MTKIASLASHIVRSHLLATAILHRPRADHSWEAAVEHILQNDTLIGTNSTDNISGGNGNDTILGGGGADILSGDNGNDVIDGGAGDDSISGGNGNDVLNGGSGSDLLFGNNGDDTAVYVAVDNLTAQDVYEGGNGTDTLVLKLTRTQLDEMTASTVLADFRAAAGTALRSISRPMASASISI